jgi:two-component system, cell cycle response regulator
VTLRGRLTLAFLVVVLGPVVLGAVFVGGTMSAAGEDRSAYRLDVAAHAVETAVAARCRQLLAVAEAVAGHPEPEREALAAALVAGDHVAAVQVRDSSGAVALAAGAVPPRPWADCDAPDPAVAGGYGAFGARAQVPDADGTPTSESQPAEVWAVQRLDKTLDLLAAAAGAEVNVLAPTGAAAEIGRDLAPGEVGRAATGDWLRRIDPAPGQPLPLMLTTPADHPLALPAVLIVAVLVATALAIGSAWWLARSASRPLTEIARAADRVADGDLTTRVPVRTADEAGQLAGAFNRMTQRTSAYVQALTASRDQLRGHLAMLGDTLSSTHDLRRILRVILQTALSATGARAGAVMLLDPAGETLTGQFAEAGAGGAQAGEPREPGDQPDQEWTTPLTVPVSGSLLGVVATGGQGRRGMVEVDGTALHPDEPRCSTYVVAPISAPGARGSLPPWPAPSAVRGVLALYDRLGGEEFDDTDLVTLRTFASQAAVAVDNVRTHEEAQRLSLTDPLTGLWNYRHLTDVLRREVERASRFSHTLTVLALDLDRFKEVNDVYGHPAGDAVLAEFARRIQSEVREVDYAFRQGGEEFVVLLPETDAKGGVTVAERLGAAVRRRPIVITPRGAGGEVPVAVTVSIGVAVYPDHGLSPPALLDAADDALYAAKAAGRDTHRVATGMPEPVAADELTVRDAARTPDGDLPRAGAGQSVATDGGAQPPRQSRGR